MWWLIILLTLLLVLLLWLLWAPLTLVIDSSQGLYRISWWGIASARIFAHEEQVLMIRFNIFFLRKNLGLVDMLNKEKKAKTEKSKAKKKKYKGPGWRKIKSGIASFRVKEFHVELDTGDYVWNAWLFPIAYFVSRGNVRLQINFNRHNSARIVIENRMIRLLYAFLK